MNDESLQSIAELVGVSGSKVVKLPGGADGHHTKDDEVPLDPEMHNLCRTIVGEALCVLLGGHDGREVGAVTLLR